MIWLMGILWNKGCFFIVAVIYKGRGISNIRNKLIRDLVK